MSSCNKTEMTQSSKCLLSTIGASFYEGLQGTRILLIDSTFLQLFGEYHKEHTVC